MRALTVGASSIEVAQRLSSALADFHPEILGGDVDGYQVRVSLAGGDRRVIEVLNAIERYVSDRQAAAPIELDGRRYTVHPE
jgi:hypothetical protein